MLMSTPSLDKDEHKRDLLDNTTHTMKVGSLCYCVHNHFITAGHVLQVGLLLCSVIEELCSFFEDLLKEGQTPMSAIFPVLMLLGAATGGTLLLNLGVHVDYGTNKVVAPVRPLCWEWSSIVGKNLAEETVMLEALVVRPHPDVSGSEGCSHT